MKKKSIIILTLAVLVISGCGKTTDTHTDSTVAVQEEKNTQATENTSTTNYKIITSETKTLTDNEKNDIMQAYPFAKTEGYISNEEIRNYMGDDTVASFANIATVNISRLYNINAVSIKENEDGYRELFSSIVSSDCIYGTDGGSYSDEWLDAVLESDSSISATFATGKEYVYADDTELYVRGILNLKVESSKDIEKIQKFLPVDVEIGTEYNFVMDIGFLALGENSDENSCNTADENGKISYILALAVY